MTPSHCRQGSKELLPDALPVAMHTIISSEAHIFRGRDAQVSAGNRGGRANRRPLRFPDFQRALFPRAAWPWFWGLQRRSRSLPAASAHPSDGNDRGLIASTVATERIASAANPPKIAARDTSASRSTPKPQSAKPPQLMLTRFMIP